MAECIKKSAEAEKIGKFPQVGTILLALGGNSPGTWGSSGESLARACRELEAAGVRILRSSSLYLTEPVGGGRQPPYLNAVIMVAAGPAPSSLLRLVKRIERRAGRRIGPWARPVDLDILSYGAWRLNWGALRRERGRLILPHPHLHTRTFVLVPLLEIAPHWHHPVLGRAAWTLLAKLAPKARSGVHRLGTRPLHRATRGAADAAARPLAHGRWVGQSMIASCA